MLQNRWSDMKVWATTQYVRVREGLKRKKAAYGITANFILGGVLANIGTWWSGTLFAALLGMDLLAAWYHGADEV